MSPEREERLFGSVTLNRITFACGACSRVHATLRRSRAGDWLLGFAPPLASMSHVEGTRYAVRCPDCAAVEVFDLPLPADEFHRVLGEHQADIRNWHPFG